MRNSKLAIETDGTITAIYDDELLDLVALGHATITRVSSVEPIFPDERPVVWQATMTDGTVLPGYTQRADALAAEVAYLEIKLF